MAAAVRQRPTRRQLEVLRAYIATGSITAAANDLEIAESTARQHLSGLYRLTGCLNAAQAAYRLGREDARWGAHSRQPHPAVGTGGPVPPFADRMPRT
jgi:DNA-binding NarL/FixJ family response regulator